jgi:hypothetical protein
MQTIYHVRNWRLPGIIALAFSVSLLASSGGSAQDSKQKNCYSIDCTPKENCAINLDTRDCNTCVISLFGKCIQRASDPACESAKIAQNALYAAQKASCEAKKAADRDACEALKAKLAAVCLDDRSKDEH